MPNPLPFTLSNGQVESASAAVGAARAFVEAARFPLGSAMIAHAWHAAPAEQVVTELAKFQNDDGGFGQGLEVDIQSPASNPFAARLAMNVLLTLRDRPWTGVTAHLQHWLESNQDSDGDWHFSEETRSGELAPWFAGWTFPSLNPACCLAGLANALGIATPRMLERVASLFAAKATLDEARNGEFYNVLPYIEYARGVDYPGRDIYLGAIAENIERSAQTGAYADASHFWEHVLGGGPELMERLPRDILAHQADRLISEQVQDGGWPTPYNDAWRPIITAQACLTLARLSGRL